VEQWEHRIQIWESEKPIDFEVNPKGNSMTQKFYAKHILPKHLEQIQQLKKEFNCEIYLLEDNDPSHGTRSKHNVCIVLKQAAGVVCIIHPAQSPDLNAIEAIWQIIKQRLRKRDGSKWLTVADFKAAIKEEWDAVTQEEIQKRIDEMPWRCVRVQQLEGRRIRSKLW
jgi:hypothetical protein